MSAWRYLFENEFTLRRDINSLQHQLEWSEESETNTRAALQRLAGEVDALHTQVGRLELVCEALVVLLETHGGLSREELALLITRLDLVDGVEDGRLGPDRTSLAPSCGACGRPVNPQRDACVFCGTIVARTPAETRKRKETPPERLVSCAACGERVAERSVYFTEQGMVCEPCYQLDQL